MDFIFKILKSAGQNVSGKIKTLILILKKYNDRSSETGSILSE